MEGHKAWVQQGLHDKVFLLVGSLAAGQGGAVLAHNVTLEALQARVSQDPFVQERVVEADIVEFTPSASDDRLAFLRQ